MIKAPGSTFLNVDINIISRVPLDPLVQALGKKVDVLQVGGSGRRFEAHVELAGSGYRESAGSLIRRLVALVTQLRGAARKLWNGAQARWAGNTQGATRRQLATWPTQTDA